MVAKIKREDCIIIYLTVPRFVLRGILTRASSSTTTVLPSDVAEPDERDERCEVSEVREMPETPTFLTWPKLPNAAKCPRRPIFPKCRTRPKWRIWQKRPTCPISERRLVGKKISGCSHALIGSYRMRPILPKWRRRQTSSSSPPTRQTWSKRPIWTTLQTWPSGPIAPTSPTGVASGETFSRHLPFGLDIHRHRRPLTVYMKSTLILCNFYDKNFIV